MDRAVAVILTTVPQDYDWESLARDAVDASLAACIQCDAPLQSVYSWQGQISTDTERRLVIKTSQACVQPLYEFVRARHPYELPQWIVLRGEASESYAAWLHGLTGTRTNDQ